MNNKTISCKPQTQNSKLETRRKKPRLPFFSILSMSMGFMGIQFAFALQNGNASRILRGFGADMEQLSWFWVAAPLTGMIIQPIIGHYSDQTWTKLGRRRPFFLVGALLAVIALILMPNAGSFANYLPPLLFGGAFLMIMDASINVAMEPFRALVADMLPKEQITLGFSIQSFLIGIGAVIGSWLPYIFAEWLGFEKVASAGQVAPNVTYAFYTGSTVLIITILWTVITTKEYSPQQLAEYSNDQTQHKTPTFSDIFKDIGHMPKTMKQLAVVQFFTWIALFGMWVFTTDAVAQHVYKLPISDVTSLKYQKAGNWVGFIFGVYNAVAMIYALLLPTIAKFIGRKMTHTISLICGGLGLISIYFIGNPIFLILSMTGVGIAWGSILAMPYAILAPSLPSQKTGVYMGIFNIFITFPQIINGLFGGMIVKRVYHSHAIYALLMSGVF
ncbi:MAG TPA: SLC45 family MFS transporter [Bacteroidales bacterium]|nr:SLC45 family MFS transporter [Bacteroidales bacterium]